MLRLALTLFLGLAASAQVPHGHALVVWKPSNPTATGGMRLVDPLGANQVVTGLSTQTIGTTRWDGAQSGLVADAYCYAGLGVDNRTGSVALPLELRRIVLSGANAVVDLPFATLMQVPVGAVWKVSDIKMRANGELLVSATEVLFTSNPMPKAAVFLVTPGGGVTSVATTGMPFGSLDKIADGGDRFVVGLVQSAIIVNIDVWSMPFSPAGAAPYRVCTFVASSSIGGLEFDVDGTLLVAIKFMGGSVARVAHAPGATPTLVASVPTSAAAADILPGPALAAVFAQPTLIAGALSLVDCNTGSAVQWASAVVRDPIDVSVRADPAVYGPASSQSGSAAWLGSDGGWPSVGNAAFGLRAGGRPSAVLGIVVAAQRASVQLPFGTLLVDPLTLVPLASALLSAQGTARIALPIPGNPNLIGGVLVMQGAVVDIGLNTIDLSRGLELTLL